MNTQDINAVLDRMASGCAKAPTAMQRSVLIESLIDNRLTAEEVRRAYVAVRDALKPWWPTPGEFLALARPAASSATVESEANTLFDLVKANRGQAYGRYSPEVGIVRERRLIEAAHGRAAGLAFVACGGSAAFSAMTERSEPWDRKRFCEAYESARADHGAPLTLDPARMLPPATASAPQLEGAVESTPAEPGEQELRFRAMVVGFRAPGRGEVVDFEARVRKLREQAQQLGEVSA